MRMFVLALTTVGLTLTAAPALAQQCVRLTFNACPAPPQPCMCCDANGGSMPQDGPNGYGCYCESNDCDAGTTDGGDAGDAGGPSTDAGGPRTDAGPGLDAGTCTGPIPNGPGGPSSFSSSSAEYLVPYGEAICGLIAKIPYVGPVLAAGNNDLKLGYSSNATVSTSTKGGENCSTESKGESTSSGTVTVCALQVSLEGTSGTKDVTKRCAECIDDAYQCTELSCQTHTDSLTNKGTLRRNFVEKAGLGNLILCPEGNAQCADLVKWLNQKFEVNVTASIAANGQTTASTENATPGTCQPCAECKKVTSGGGGGINATVGAGAKVNLYDPGRDSWWRDWIRVTVAVQFTASAGISFTGTKTKKSGACGEEDCVSGTAQVDGSAIADGKVRRRSLAERRVLLRRQMQRESDGIELHGKRAPRRRMQACLRHHDGGRWPMSRTRNMLSGALVLLSGFALLHCKSSTTQPDAPLPSVGFLQVATDGPDETVVGSFAQDERFGNLVAKTSADGKTELFAVLGAARDRIAGPSFFMFPHPMATTGFRGACATEFDVRDRGTGPRGRVLEIRRDVAPELVCFVNMDGTPGWKRISVEKGAEGGTNYGVWGLMVSAAAPVPPAVGGITILLARDSLFDPSWMFNAGRPPRDKTVARVVQVNADGTGTSSVEKEFGTYLDATFFAGTAAPSCGANSCGKFWTGLAMQTCPKTCAAGESCQSNTCKPGACTPLAKTQACATSEGAKRCGDAVDGCGGTIDCGGCAQGESCGGGGAPGICGSYRLTEERLRSLYADNDFKLCGKFDDLLGGTLDLSESNKRRLGGAECAAGLTCRGNFCR
jgi:hypothetical protein